MRSVLPLFFLLLGNTVMAQLPIGTDSAVGVGTASPLYRLDVNTARDNDGLRLRSFSPGQLRLALSNVPAAKQYSFLVAGPSSAFGAGNFVITDISRLDSVRLLINGNTGNIAIGGGSTNPDARLAVNGMIQATTMRLTSNAGTNLIMGSDANGNATWQPANALNLISGSGSFNYVTKWTPNGFTLGNSQMVDDGTYVGIGNVTPQYKLDLGTAQDNDGLRLRSTNAGNLRLRFNNAGTNKEYSMLLGGTASAYGNGNLAITDGGNGDSARLLINGNTGNIGIGSNNPNPAEKLTVKGGIQADSLKIPVNAGAGKVLTSDANGVASWQPASAGTITGAGTTGTLPLWTPNSTTLGNSQVTDNGTAVGINNALPQYKLDISTATGNDGLRISNSSTGNSSLRLRSTTANKEYNVFVGGSASSFGSGNFAVADVSKPDTAAIIVWGSNGNVGIGLSSGHTPAEQLVVGGNIEASAIRLYGGVPGINKILVSDVSGLGTWQSPGTANIVSGSGTLNYVPKWTPNGFTMSNSQIVDDGTSIGIGNVAPLRKLDINSPSNYTGVNITSPQIATINLTSTNTSNTGRELLRFGEPAATPGGNVNAQIGYYRTAEATNPGNMVLSVDNAGIRPDLSISKNNNGNVGIGLINATQKLDVNGTIRATGLLIPTNAGAGKVLTSDAVGNATWQTAPGAGTNTVIYSNWIIPAGLNRDTAVDGTCIKVKHIDAPSLSATALSNAVVMVYMRVGSIGPYHLPYISDAGAATNQIQCIYNAQKIFLYRHTFKSCRYSSSVPESYVGEPVMVNLATALEFRYVIVLGTQPGGRVALGPNEHYASSLDAIPDMEPGAAVPGKSYSTVKD